MIPDWLYTNVANPGSVETCTVYEVAPLEAFHVRVGVLDTLVAPLIGELSVGAAGGLPAAVVKLHVLDQALVPPAFVAFTLQ